MDSISNASKACEECIMKRSIESTRFIGHCASFIY